MHHREHNAIKEFFGGWRHLFRKVKYFFTEKDIRRQSNLFIYWLRAWNIIAYIIIPNPMDWSNYKNLNSILWQRHIFILPVEPSR